MLRRIVLILVLTALGMTAGAQTKAPAKKTTTAKRPAEASGAGPSAASASFNPALLQPAKLTAKAPEVYDAKFTTTKGDFVVRVTRAWAPQGADRFYNLVKNGFFDGASFFRVVPGFVVQFGLSAHPQVSQAWQAARIQDDPVKQSNKRGYITFATGGPDTRTTQMFINLADNARLDSMGFSPLGEVVEGMEIVEQLYGGYGDGPPRGNGPKQDLIGAQGKAYLDKEFPKLDSIKSATIVQPAAQPKATPKKQPAKR